MDPVYMLTVEPDGRAMNSPYTPEPPYGTRPRDGNAIARGHQRSGESGTPDGGAGRTPDGEALEATVCAIWCTMVHLLAPDGGAAGARYRW